jgi:N-methylhydantoinase B/oxoprolinase/acetone carboxylase alpha subunit
MSLGPIEIEVIRNALTAAAAEMDITIWRTSRSTTVRELLDYSTHSAASEFHGRGATHIAGSLRGCRGLARR